MTYRSFIEFINEEGDGSIGGTVAVDASPTPIANTTKNFVNPNNKKLMPSILRRPKIKTIGSESLSDNPPDTKPNIPEPPKPESIAKPSLPSVKQTPPKLGVNPPKIKTMQKYT